MDKAVHDFRRRSVSKRAGRGSICRTAKTNLIGYSDRTAREELWPWAMRMAAVAINVNKGEEGDRIGKADLLPFGTKVLARNASKVDEGGKKIDANMAEGIYLGPALKVTKASIAVR